MNRNELIDVLTTVAGAYNRTIGEADLIVWRDIIGDVPKEFALTAIRDHLREQPGVWLEPGHIWQRWVAYRRDQLARESREAREARQAALDARFAEAVDELTEATALPIESFKFQRRPAAPELAVACPWRSCRAKPKKPCVNHDGKPLLNNAFHPSRTDVVRGVA